MTSTTLYGTPLSLYTGKARSYLIKAGIAYREITTADEHFRQVVLPKAVKSTIPTLELATGEVIRDGTQIIDHFERQNPAPFLPDTPRQKLTSLLYDVIGAEGLLRPAMHYRWNYPDENLEFLKFHFGTNIPADMDRAALAEKTMNRMRNAGVSFGATPENFQQIESHYQQFLDCFNRHVSAYPYLLGARPSIGDFGLIAPMYAHLGRDPAPLSLMQARAIQVFRWVERMNRPEPDTGEFDNLTADQYLDDDQVPQSLIDLTAHIAKDFMPETRAAAATINAWLADQQPEAGTAVERAVGFAEFEFGGGQFKAIAQPYRFYLLARVQKAYDALNKTDSAKLDDLFQTFGMTDLMTIRLTRSVRFEGNQEVWD